MAEFSLVQPVHHDTYPFISPAEGLKGAAEGRSVLITGAGTGIGKATAEAFAQAGAKNIIITGRRLEVLEKVEEELSKKYAGCKIIAEKCDVSKQEDVDTIFQKLQGMGVELEVLCNNAGVDGGYTTIRDSDVDHWWKAFEIMVKGPYMLTRAFLHARKSTCPAAIVNTSTIGSYNTLPTFSSYATCKAALNRITEYVAQEENGNGVQCIAFHPGGVADTVLTAASPEWMQQYYIDTVELAAHAGLYLSTPRAAWLSGRYVDARWDMEELEKSKAKIEEEKLLRMSLLGDVRVFP